MKEFVRKVTTFLILLVSISITSFAQNQPVDTSRHKSQTNPAAVSLHPAATPNTSGKIELYSSGSRKDKSLNNEELKEEKPVRDTSDKMNKMLNDYAKTSVENLGPIRRSMMDPDQKRAQDFYERGTAKLRNDDPRGAIEDFTMSLNLYRLPTIFMVRGIAELLVEDYGNALNDLDNALKLNPDLQKAFFARGVCHFELNQFKDAEADMKKFVENDQTNAMAYNYLAGCAYLRDDITAALQNYKIVASLDPKFPDVYTNSGMMRHYLQDLNGAIEDYNKALAVDPKNSTAYNNRGGAELSLGYAKNALDDFNTAINLQANYADAYENRGKAKMTLGDKLGACEDFRKAASLGLETTKELIDKYCN